jgi:sulfur relay (sulfurtransferase) DsrF/TusC family protein
MAVALPVLDCLIQCSSTLAQRARGRDAVDLALASLALGWSTGVLLCDGARDWLHAQAAQVGAADPFARTLASLPLYELQVLYVLDDLHRDWPSLRGLPVVVLPTAQLPRILSSARRVLHP